MGHKPVSQFSLYPLVLRRAEHLVSPQWDLPLLLSFSCSLCYYHYQSYLSLPLWDTASFLCGGDVTGALQPLGFTLEAFEGKFQSCGEVVNGSVLSTGGTSPFRKLPLSTYQCSGPDWESRTGNLRLGVLLQHVSEQQRLPSILSNCEPCRIICDELIIAAILSHGRTSLSLAVLQWFLWERWWYIRLGSYKRGEKIWTDSRYFWREK